MRLGNHCRGEASGLRDRRHSMPVALGWLWTSICQIRSLRLWAISTAGFLPRALAFIMRQGVLAPSYGHVAVAVHTKKASCPPVYTKADWSPFSGPAQRESAWHRSCAADNDSMELVALSPAEAWNSRGV